ncbi:unnamed protein product [Trichogramma brassicae]|uniref:Uncharacterized protein n=1 Tax=Trichogramma brassicae TaxID=86971 RepID=A0A6H5J1I5_9HYME|nr:unnamed protein product [Trichogramma brassicae]
MVSNRENIDDFMPSDMTYQQTPSVPKQTSCIIKASSPPSTESDKVKDSQWAIYFSSLLPHTRRVENINKLDMCNEINKIVNKFAYDMQPAKPKQSVVSPPFWPYPFLQGNMEPTTFLHYPNNVVKEEAITPPRKKRNKIIHRKRAINYDDGSSDDDCIVIDDKFVTVKQEKPSRPKIRTPTLHSQPSNGNFVTIELMQQQIQKAFEMVVPQLQQLNTSPQLQQHQQQQQQQQQQHSKVATTTTTSAAAAAAAATTTTTTQHRQLQDQLHGELTRQSPNALSFVSKLNMAPTSFWRTYTQISPRSLSFVSKLDLGFDQICKKIFKRLMSQDLMITCRPSAVRGSLRPVGRASRTFRRPRHSLRGRLRENASGASDSRNSPRSRCLSDLVGLLALLHEVRPSGSPSDVDWRMGIAMLRVYLRRLEASRPLSPPWPVYVAEATGCHQEDWDPEVSGVLCSVCNRRLDAPPPAAQEAVPTIEFPDDEVEIPTYERAQIVHLPQKLCRNSGGTRCRVSTARFRKSTNFERKLNSKMQKQIIAFTSLLASSTAASFQRACGGGRITSSCLWRGARVSSDHEAKKKRILRTDLTVGLPEISPIPSGSRTRSGRCIKKRQSTQIEDESSEESILQRDEHGMRMKNFNLKKLSKWLSAQADILLQQRSVMRKRCTRHLREEVNKRFGQDFQIIITKINSKLYKQTGPRLRPDFLLVQAVRSSIYVASTCVSGFYFSINCCCCSVASSSPDGGIYNYGAGRYGGSRIYIQRHRAAAFAFRAPVDNISARAATATCARVSVHAALGEQLSATLELLLNALYKPALA